MGRTLPLQHAFALLDERFILDAFLQGKRAFAINNPDVHGITTVRRKACAHQMR
jgi:hypothetical protein